VHEAHRRFRSEHADLGVEQFLLAASRGKIAMPDRYLSSEFPPWGTGPHHQLRLSELVGSLPWQWVVGAIQIRLAQPDSRRRPSVGDHTARYRPELVRLSHCPTHRLFSRDVLATRSQISERRWRRRSSFAR
jgi:hypothetical protein